jgi:hypothetical protein
MMSRVRQRDERGDDPTAMPAPTRKPRDPTSYGPGFPSLVPVQDMGPDTNPIVNLPSLFNPKFDNDKGYKIKIDSNGTLNFSIQISAQTRRERQKTGIEMTTFVHNRKMPRSAHDLGEHDMLSWSAMNHELKYNFNFLTEYEGDDCRKWSAHWRHYGTQVREQTRQQAVAMHAFRRAKGYNLHTALNHKATQRDNIRPHDDLWILVVRRDIDYDSELLENRTSAFATGVKLPKTYWQLLPFVSTTGQRPRFEMYSQSPSFDVATNTMNRGWTGDAIHLGTIARVFGSNKNMVQSQCLKARGALCPATLDDQAKQDLYTLSTYEIFRL